MEIDAPDHHSSLRIETIFLRRDVAEVLQKMAEHSEKRNYPRLPVDLVTFLTNVDEHRFDLAQETVTVNLSQTGLFIESKTIFDTGTFIEFDLLLPEEEQGVSYLVCVTGIVRWCSKAEPRGIGVEILRESTTDMERLDRFLQQLCEEIEAENEE